MKVRNSLVPKKLSLVWYMTMFVPLVQLIQGSLDLLGLGLDLFDEEVGQQGGLLREREIGVEVGGCGVGILLQDE